MFRLTLLLKSSNELCRNLLCAKEVVVNGGPKSPGILSRAGVSSLSTASKSFPSSGSISDRVYADYSIFKGKAALTVSPRLPTFTKLDSGSLKVERRGVMMLTFMPAVGERKYSWEKKQVFALSPTEVGTLISLGPNDSCEFFHDPSMLSSNAGQVRKTLLIKAIGDSSGGYFISMNVVNNLLKTNERFSVPVTPGEFTVIKTACSFALPHIMGWDRVTGLQPQTAEANPSKVDRRLLDQEWDK